MALGARFSSERKDNEVSVDLYENHEGTWGGGGVKEKKRKSVSIYGIVKCRSFGFGVRSHGLVICSLGLQFVPSIYTVRNPRERIV